MADRFDIITPSGERITPDVATRVGHSLAAELTEFPVEDGLPVNDALRRAPRTLPVDLVFSAYRTDRDNGATVPDPGHPQSVFERFLSLHKRGEACTIVTRREVLQNMVLIQFDADDDADTTQVLRCRVTFKELRIASSRLIQIPPKRRSVAQRHRSRRRGAGAVEAKKPAEAARKKKLKAAVLAEARRRLGIKS